jgi:hypothetical protein
MQDTDRNAFEEILGEIFAAVDKPLGEAQRSVFWKGLKDISILEFARCRDMLVKDFREREEPPRKLTLADIWAARKRLRAVAPPKDDTPKWDGDVWDIAANNRMLGLVMRWALARRKMPAEHVRVFVAFKNRWAELMRESAVDGSVPVDEQNQCWKECLRMAEEAIAQERKAA